MGWMPSYPTFDRNPLDLADEAAAAGRPVAEHVVDQLKSGDLRFACEDPDSPENFPRILAIWRANLLGSSGKGNEYFLKHLLGADSSLRASEAAEGQRPQDVDWHDEAPEGKLDLLLTPGLPADQHDDLLRRRAAGGHLVREARPQHHRHAPVRALVQPRDRAAVADPHRLGRLADDRHEVQRARRRAPRHPHATWSPCRCCTTPPTRWPTRTAWSGTGRHGECEPVPGVTMPKLVEVERDYAAVGAQDAGARPADGEARHDDQGRHLRRDRVGRLPARRRTARSAADPPTAGPSLKRDVHACEAILALSGTTNGHLATQGFKTLEKRTGTLLHDLAAEHEGKQITFADTQAAPVPVITSPGVVRVGDRRPALLAVHDQRRAAQALAHADRPAALLPRPRLDDRARRGPARSTGRR